MPEYISRDDLLNAINTNVAEAHGERCSQLLEAILNAPTADVVEVVRCKDCKHRGDGVCPMCFEEYSASDDGEGYMVDDWITIDNTQDDAFCSYGERKDN